MRVRRCEMPPEENVQVSPHPHCREGKTKAQELSLALDHVCHCPVSKEAGQLPGEGTRPGQSAPTSAARSPGPPPGAGSWLALLHLPARLCPLRCRALCEAATVLWGMCPEGKRTEECGQGRRRRTPHSSKTWEPPASPQQTQRS